MINDIRFYVSVFFRRLHYFMLVAITLTAAGVATAVILPTKYESEALLLVESPQIPDELAASTVQTNTREQLQIIEQRLLTRPTLLDVAREHRVFDEEDGLFPDEIVDKMREATRTEITTGRDQASLFRITFRAKDPLVAASVVNDYLTRVLQDNVELRTDRAEGTMVFFEQEVQRLGEDLAKKSAEILEFKNSNLDALPENLDYQLSRLDDQRDRIEGITRELTSLARQRERLILVYNATGGAVDQSQDLRSPKERELRDLEDNLASALTIYSEQNPRVRALRARVEGLRAELGISEDPGDEETDGEAVAVPTILDIQLMDIDGRIEQLTREREVIQAEIAQLRENIDEVPANSIALEGLMRDYEIIQAQYNVAVQRSSAAATGERIELTAKGERISVISQPVVPREPSSPNRPLIAALGLFAGIGGGFALVVLLELLNSSIRRPVDLTRALGITPLATLPLIRTPGEVVLRRGTVAVVILTGAIGITTAIFYTHTQIMPIDLIATKAIDQIGL